jgi:hypothetical protein
MMFKKGLLPPRPGAVKLLFGDYAKPSLPQRPDQFGHDSLVAEWHMLGNDRVGCCAWSGAAHETYLWTASAGQRARITTADVLADYAEATGYMLGDPSTDQGTDMQAAASYRRKTGIRDALGRRHKIAAYVAPDPKNPDQLLTASWLFSAVGLGVTVGANSEEQFARGVPWDGDPGANSGGHYVPLVAFRHGLAWVVTWGRLQAVTLGFLRDHCDQALAYLSPDMMRGGKSLEGFDLAALQSDLTALTA